ncbi:phospholipase D-like domain-containing protein [Xanthomonas campestris]|nr:phospholipase D-like domain-containing protein [Xanthomonas campestris]
MDVCVICAAARRGVQVRLIVQGQPDTPLALLAARLLYRQLLAAGVQVFEYCERPFHGKVAVIDGHWSTVGSSNLDPLSLALNLEANVLVRDHAFAKVLRERLQRLMTQAREVAPNPHHPATAPSDLGSLAPLTTPVTSRTSAPAWPITEL